MKRIFSLLLVIAMVLTIIPTSYAKTAPYDEGTLVRYNGQADELYTITVPALLLPGNSGTVTLSGTWASDRVVSVTADEDVTLTNSIKADDQKVLSVNFAGIEEQGSNTKSLTFSESVSVDAITNAIFGVWSGTFYYNVSIEDYETVNKTKNEYGFYYNVPYIHTYKVYEGYAEEFSEGFVFYEDGTMMVFTPYYLYDDNYNSVGTINGLFAYESEWTWEYDSESNSLKENRHTYDYVFSDDGESFVVDDVTYTASGVAHGIYYHREYVSDDGDTITFVPGQPDWWAKEYIATDVQSDYYVSIDGMVLIVGDKLYYRGGYGHVEAMEHDEYGLFDANGVQLACFNSLVNDYKLKLNFGSHNELYTSTQTIGYLIETYPELSTGTKLVFPPELTSLGSYALAAGGWYITELILPSSLRYMDHYTLTGVGAEEIILPNGLEYVGDLVFNALPNLKTLTIPDSVTQMEYTAIQGCDNLETLYLSDNLTMLDYYTAYYCPALKEITLGSKLQFIDMAAFYGCPNVEKLYFRGTVEQWNNIELETNYKGEAFNKDFTNTKLNEVICTDGVTCIVHTGDGDTTCSTKPICEVCGYGFGIYKEHNLVVDDNPIYSNADDEYGNYHTISATCSDCGAAGEITKSHSMVVDDNPTVTPNTNRFDTWGHLVSTHCEYCDKTGYKSQQHNSIAGETMYLTEQKHSQNFVCQDCGLDYWVVGLHEGGVGNCSALGKCSVCNHPYGDYGAHVVENGVCTLCGKEAMVFQTAHYPYTTGSQEIDTVLGTWDYSDAKSVNITIYYGSYETKDALFLFKGTSCPGFGQNGTFLGKNGKLEKCTSSYSGVRFSGNQYGVTTTKFENVDMLVGGATISFQNYNTTGYGFTVVVEPNY